MVVKPRIQSGWWRFMRSPREWPFRQWRRLIQGVVIVIALLVWLQGVPAIAQTQDTPTQPPTAEVVVDGLSLFEVTSTQELSAQERAEGINAQLRTLVETDTPIRVRIEDRGGLPVIWANGTYVLSVTNRDTSTGRDLQEQAQLWAQQLETALERARAERSWEFLQRALLMAIAVAALAVTLHWLLGRIWQQTLQPFLQGLVRSDGEDADPQPSRALNVLLGITLFLLRTALWISALLYISNLFPVTRQWSYRITEILVSSFISPNLNLGQEPVSTLDLLLLAIQLFGLVIVAGALTNLLRRRVLTVAGINRGAQEAIAIIVKYGIISLGSIVLLQLWGINLSSLAILASALGVGIGFGLQDIAKNFGSGLVLVFERPVQVGDFIEVGEFMGTVERIGARSTEIKTLDHISIIVPNSRFLEQEVINWSHRNPLSRLRLPVGVAYSSDPATVKSVLIEAGRKHPSVLATPPPNVFFKGFGDNALNFELLVWIAEPSKQPQIKSDLYFQIESLLRQHQISVPFPQRDLHVSSGSLPLELPPELQHFLKQWSRQNGSGSAPTWRSPRDESERPGY